MSRLAGLACLAALATAAAASAQTFTQKAVPGGVEWSGPFAYAGNGIEGFEDFAISLAFDRDYDVSVKSSSPLTHTGVTGTYYEHFHTYLDGVELYGNDARIRFHVEMTPNEDRTFWSGRITGVHTRRIQYEYYTDVHGVQHELMTMRWYDKNVWLSGGYLYEPDVDGGWRFTLTAAPEPSSWALMIVGFGLAGGALRRHPTRCRA